jgi:SsrA-binding protein
MTLVPLKLYINDRGYAKIELGIAKHKKLIDKRKLLKERDIARQTAREIKIRVR